MSDNVLESLNEELYERIQKEIESTDLIYKIGRIFSAGEDLVSMLNQVMEQLAKRLSVIRGAINVYNEQQERIYIDSSYGYTSEEVKKGMYKPGEGVIGTVFKTGKPIVVPSIDNEPLFLNKTGARKGRGQGNCVFICVPIETKGSVIGTISIDKEKQYSESFLEELNILSTVAIMIATAVDERRHALMREEELKEENRLLKIKLNRSKSSGKLIGNSQLMRDIYEKILLVAPTKSTVLINGESGTGKEIIADEVYENSDRKGMPYVKVNIAALPDNLIESELFGHEKGAFTGAHSQKKGRFELANGGTIFLDEIGDLNLQGQVKLLRVLQEKSIERIGGTKTIPLDVRIIAATHQNLEKKVEEGNFRLDLYYRLNVFQIYSPPLRERKADIMLLADYFLEKYSAELKKRINRISSEAINMLVSYHWPGNVRELENCIQRAVIINEENVIRSTHLPPSLQIAESVSQRNMTLDEIENQYIKDIIIDNLKITSGNITKAAQRLGTTKRILNYKIKKLNINFMDYRNK